MDKNCCKIKMIIDVLMSNRLNAKRQLELLQKIKKLIDFEQELECVFFDKFKSLLNRQIKKTDKHSYRILRDEFVMLGGYFSEFAAVEHLELNAGPDEELMIEKLENYLGFNLISFLPVNIMVICLSTLFIIDDYSSPKGENIYGFPLRYVLFTLVIGSVSYCIWYFRQYKKGEACYKILIA